MAEIEISDINRMANESPERLVKESEARYKSFVSEVASRIASDEKIRIVLLAGPSGSGKTTTANLLADGIRSLGLSSSVISLDNFYRNADDPDYPRLENGDRDLESVDALDIGMIEGTLAQIADGRDYEIPYFDFKEGRKTKFTKHPGISHGCVIIEGLHALNPKISEHLPTERVIRIFISVSTNINDGERRILSGRKMRFVRRMARDSVYRGADAAQTLAMWENVLRGEDAHLYPYRHLADIDFNTFHEYEPCVMRKFAERLITKDLAEKSDYAKTVLTALTRAAQIDEALVPADSLMREFITGGIYEEFY